MGGKQQQQLKTKLLEFFCVYVCLDRATFTTTTGAKNNNSNHIGVIIN